MKLLHFLALAGFLLALETAFPVWRSSAPVSTAPVFSLPMMDEAMKNPGGFQRSIDVYKADRGGEMKLSGPNDTQLTVFYFEWDEIEAGPVIDIGGHTADVCNTAAGFTLQKHWGNRSYQPMGGEKPLIFDTMTFTDPAGTPTHVYKMAWIQGLGSWDTQEGGNRGARLSKSFRRGIGAARVLEVGVSGVADEKSAWQVLQNEVLTQLVWNPQP